jgi:hypothetical protein
MFRALRLIMATVVAVAAAGAATSLTRDPPPLPLSMHDWVGVWLDGRNVVWISGNPDETLSIVAAAYHPTADGQIADARLDFEAAPGGARLSRVGGGDANCAALITNTGGTTLVVEDNGRCAGGAVRFDGVYRHQ